MTQRCRQDLHTRLVAAFAAGAEVSAIHVFGREVADDVDEFSDIDMVICSSDLRLTQAQHREILSAISPVRASFCIVSDEHQIAQMIMLKDYSPYQKIDFEITDHISRKQAFAPFKCIYQRDPTPAATHSALQIHSERMTLANQFNDILFSIPRFTKCLFRRDRDLYRRWVGVTEHLAVLLYESHFGWGQIKPSRLSPPQYKAVHHTLDNAATERMEAIWPVGGNPCLPESFRLAIDWIIELTAAKAKVLDTTVDMDFAQYLQAFLGEELRRWQAGQPSVAPIPMQAGRPA
jgi:hypothetical protein